MRTLLEQGRTKNGRRTVLDRNYELKWAQIGNCNLLSDQRRVELGAIDVLQDQHQALSTLATMSESLQLVVKLES